jgi:hypothetical protein
LQTKGVGGTWALIFILQPRTRVNSTLTGGHLDEKRSSGFARRIGYNPCKVLKYFTSGESHGEALVAFLSGLPAGLGIDLEFVNRELWRRQQGFGRGGRMKIERDTAHILSGVRSRLCRAR